MSTLFVAAEPRECSGWLRHWQDCHPVSLPVRWAREGSFRGKKVIAVANGAGEARAHAAVESVQGIRTVVSIGLCGALDPALRIADTVVAGEVRHKGNIWKTADIGPILITIDHIAATREEKHTLHDAGASIVEMEAAGVARAAMTRGLTFRCIKAVSDLADETFVNDLNAALQPDGTFSTGRIVFNALANPVPRFRELIRLGRRSAEASKKLGDYLATCEF